MRPHWTKQVFMSWANFFIKEKEKDMKKEAILQMQIVEMLSLYSRRNKFIFFSVPNESALTAAGGKKIYGIITNLKKMGMTPGVTDLIIGKNGKTYYLELKSNNGVLSTNQKIFRDNVIGCGFTHAVINNFTDFQNLMIAWGIF